MQAHRSHSRLQVPADHPAFAGHFPSRPLLPGVVLLSLVLEAVMRDDVLNALLGSAPAIESAKFLAPVGPGAWLDIDLAMRGDGADFEVSTSSSEGSERRSVAKGRLTPGRGT